MRAVLDAIEEGRPLPVGPSEARGSIELATAIYASSLGSEPVALPLERANPCYHGIAREEYAARPIFPRQTVNLEA
jgi:hypothetical protein